MDAVGLGGRRAARRELRSRCADRLPARHRPGAAGLRGRRLRGLRRQAPTRTSTTRSSSTTWRRTWPRCARWPSAPAPDVALANHLVMGPVILARAVGGRVPYAVKIHGSALEYTVEPHRERFLPYALEGLGPAERRAGGLAPHRPRACGRCIGRARRCRSAPGSGRPAWTSTSSGRASREACERAGARRPARAATRRLGRRAGRRRRRCASSTPRSDRIVSYVGKLIVSKGVDLLLAAWPLVVAGVPDARLVRGRLRHLPRRRSGGFVEALGDARPRGAARHRRARARARGRPAGRAAAT